MSNAIFEYRVTYGGKYYVVSNIDFKGRGIKKISNGKDHKRGLMGFLFTDAALGKAKAVHKAKYIETEH